MKYRTTLLVLIITTITIYVTCQSTYSVPIDCKSTNAVEVDISGNSVLTSNCVYKKLKLRVTAHYKLELDGNDSSYDQVTLTIIEGKHKYKRVIQPNKLYTEKFYFLTGKSRIELRNVGQTNLSKARFTYYYTSKGFTRPGRVAFGVMWGVVGLFLFAGFFAFVAPKIQQIHSRFKLRMQAIAAHNRVQQMNYSLLVDVEDGPLSRVHRKLPFSAIKHILSFVNLRLVVSPPFTLTMSQSIAIHRIFGKYREGHQTHIFQLFTDLDFHDANHLVQNAPFLVNLPDTKSITLYTIPPDHGSNWDTSRITAAYFPFSSSELEKVLQLFDNLEIVGILPAYSGFVASTGLRKLVLYEPMNEEAANIIAGIYGLQSLSVGFCNQQLFDMVNQSSIRELSILLEGTNPIEVRNKLGFADWKTLKRLDLLEIDSPCIVELEIPFPVLPVHVLKLGPNIKLTAESFEAPTPVAATDDDDNEQKYSSECTVQELHIYYPPNPAFYSKLEYFTYLQVLSIRVPPAQAKTIYKLFKGTWLHVLKLNFHIDAFDMFPTDSLIFSDDEVREFVSDCPNLRFLVLFTRTVTQSEIEFFRGTS